MTVETVEAKAVRYLAEGRLRILSVQSCARAEVFAQVRGSREVPYSVGFSGGSWWCNCPARRECAHIIAARLVVADAEDRKRYGR